MKFLYFAWRMGYYVGGRIDCCSGATRFVELRSFPAGIMRASNMHKGKLIGNEYSSLESAALYLNHSCGETFLIGSYALF